MSFTLEAIAGAVLVLAIVFAAAALIRARVGILRDLFLPTSVIGGFLALAVGPQVMGALTGGTALISQEVSDIWATFPSLLINVVFAALLLGKALPSARTMWNASSGHVMLGYGLSFGQYALGALLAVLVLVPILGLAPESAALLEIAFTGGHGTAAGMAGAFEAVGAPYLVDLALGLATIGLVAGIMVGSLLVRWAIRSPRISVARQEQLSRADDRDPGRLAAYDREAGEPAFEDRGIAPLTVTLIAIGLSIIAGWLVLEGLKALERLITGDDKLMSLMPLFPMTIIGGMLIQLLAVRGGVANRISRRRVNEVSGVALDVLILTAIATMSLSALRDNIGALVLMAAVAIGWSVAAVVVFAPRLFRSRWFENSMGDFGQSQGTIATGFLLIDMADPEHVTGATESFGYKQLLFEPFVGGGFITALSVPIIHAFGAGGMLIVSTIATVVVFALGFRLARRPSPGAAPPEVNPGPSQA